MRITSETNHRMQTQDAPVDGSTFLSRGQF